jgi:hypothetical protein
MNETSKSGIISADEFCEIRILEKSLSYSSKISFKQEDKSFLPYKQEFIIIHF